MRAQLFAQLQNIDQLLAQLVQERGEALVALEERDVLRAILDQNNRMVGQLKRERATSSDLQWELEEVEIRLRALHEQEHDGPSDPLVARELSLLQNQRTHLEEQVLQQLERIAELESTLQRSEQDYAHLVEAWAQREPEVHARLDKAGEAIEALQAERERIASQLPCAVLVQYDDLQRRHRGTALAPIRNRQCSVCHARLSAAVFDLLSDPAALVRCPRCGRVIYVDKEDRY